MWEERLCFPAGALAVVSASRGTLLVPTRRGATTAEKRTGDVGVTEAKNAVLRELVYAADNGYSADIVKTYALAYRLLTGGPQPGSSIVEKG